VQRGGASFVEADGEPGVGGEDLAERLREPQFGGEEAVDDEAEVSRREGVAQPTMTKLAKAAPTTRRPPGGSPNASTGPPGRPPRVLPSRPAGRDGGDQR